MNEQEKRAMYINEICEKVVLEADRRNSGDAVRDLYSVFGEIGVVISVVLDKIRERMGG